MEHPFQSYAKVTVVPILQSTPKKEILNNNTTLNKTNKYHYIKYPAVRSDGNTILLPQFTSPIDIKRQSQSTQHFI